VTKAINHLVGARAPIRSPPWKRDATTEYRCPDRNAIDRLDPVYPRVLSA
jgi:hypothetical protein